MKRLTFENNGIQLLPYLGSMIMSVYSARLGNGEGYVNVFLHFTLLNTPFQVPVSYNKLLFNRAGWAGASTLLFPFTRLGRV